MNRPRDNKIHMNSVNFHVKWINVLPYSYTFYEETNCILKHIYLLSINKEIN